MDSSSNSKKIIYHLVLALTAASTSIASGAQQFSSPGEAAQALVQAVDSETTEMLFNIFGEEARSLVFTGDLVQDINDFNRFRIRVKELTALSRLSDTTVTLIIGHEAWPFPIPLVSKDGKWSFDVEAGKEAVRDRRIGENEINAIKACKAYVRAQNEYAARDRDGDRVLEYAQRMISSPGQQDGLYWPVEAGSDPSPLGELFAAAAAEGYAVPQPSREEVRRGEGFHGYRYKILTKQGPNVPGGAMDYVHNGNLLTKFGLVATPVSYGETGIMTFLVDSDGYIYQKDMGNAGGNGAATIDTFNPDGTWELLNE